MPRAPHLPPPPQAQTDRPPATCLYTPHRGSRPPGLAPNDARILAEHLRRRTISPDAMYAGVAVTKAPRPENVRLTPNVIHALDVLWPHRVDLIWRDGQDWTICEIKPCASYLALGQLLFYAHHAPEHYRCLERARLAVMTDQPEPCCLPLFARHNIDVLSVPGLSLDVGDHQT